TFDSDAENSEREYYIAAATDEQLGIQFAKMLGEDLDGEGKIAFMVPTLTATNDKIKIRGAEEYLEENHPNIEIVTTVTSDDEQQKAFENAQNLISAHPDLDGVIGFAAAETPAAAQAIEQAVKDGKIEEGQVKIAGFATPSLVEKY